MTAPDPHPSAESGDDDTTGMSTGVRLAWLLDHFPREGWGSDRRTEINPVREAWIARAVVETLTAGGVWSEETALAWVHNDRFQIEVGDQHQQTPGGVRAFVETMVQQYPHRDGPAAYAVGLTISEYHHAAATEQGRHALTVLTALTTTSSGAAASTG